MTPDEERLQRWAEMEGVALGARETEAHYASEVRLVTALVVAVFATLPDEDIDALPPELRRNLERLCEAAEAHADAAQRRREIEDEAVGR